MKESSDTEPAERTSMASTKADFRELRTNSAATVQELQEFLGQLRGKSPQEMLGIVASSQLFRAIILSSILVTGLIFLFTAIPYFRGAKETTTPTETAATTPPEPQAAAKETEKPITPETPEKNTDLAPLEVNETKTAPPNVNPLEANKNDFLKDLE